MLWIEMALNRLFVRTDSSPMHTPVCFQLQRLQRSQLHTLLTLREEYLPPF